MRFNFILTFDNIVEIAIVIITAVLVVAFWLIIWAHDTKEKIYRWWCKKKGERPVRSNFRKKARKK